VQNTALGAPEKLPFDLRQNRAIKYSSAEDAPSRAAERRALQCQFENGLRLILQADKAPSERERAEEAERRRRALELFTAICSLRRVTMGGANHDEASKTAGALYGCLGADRIARYVASTAMAFFAYGRETSDTRRMGLLEEERRRVEQYLSDPSQSLDVPTGGAVRTWARDAHASTAWKGAPWLLRNDD
jgi:hypothetical protein